MSPSSYCVLVMAKAPVPGRAKTRLAATVGDEAAADVAAASLLDTIAAVGATPGAWGHLALDGDLGDACRGAEIQAALEGWTLTPQRGDGFAARLAAAHADAGPGVVVQVGMDTPQVTPDRLLAAARSLDPSVDAVLGAAHDGGWWVLARRDPAVAAPLAGVAMSTDRTYVETRAALEAAGHRVAETDPLLDVDTAADADEVASLVPRSRFAAAWHQARRQAGSPGVDR